LGEGLLKTGKLTSIPLHELPNPHDYQSFPKLVGQRGIKISVVVKREFAIKII